MPGQLFGESSSFVSYSDYPYVNKDSTWINCVSEELPWAVRPHLAFYTHGTGVRDVTVENMVSRGGVGISVATNAPGEHVRITGGEIVDGRLTLNGSGVFVDGVTLRGPHAGITLVGSDNLVQNVLIDGAVPDFGDSGAVVNYGGGNTFRFSTVRIDPASGWPAAAFVLKTFWWATGPRIYGNIIDAPRAFRLQNDPPEAFTSDHNLFAREPEFMMSDGSVRDLAKWRAELGQDGSSVVADPLFADPAAGDLSLREGSPAVDAFEPTDLLEGIAIDLLGTPRPQGAAYDLGALERRG